MQHFVRPKYLKYKDDYILEHVSEPTEVYDVDKVFNWQLTAVRSPIANNGGRLSQDFFNPTFQSFYINTIEDCDLKDDLLVMDQHNIPIPIKNHYMPNQIQNLFELVQYLKYRNGLIEKMEKFGRVPEGLFVVEYIRVTSDTMRDSDKYLSILLDQSRYQDETDIDMFSVIKNAYPSLLVPNEINKSLKVKETGNIRIVYFISKETLINHQAVYFQPTNIVITSIKDARGVFHPSSMKYKKLKEARNLGLNVDLTVRTTMSYRVVLNRDIGVENFYMNSGGKVTAIKVEISDKLKEGVYYTKSINGTTAASEYYTLDEARQKLNIFKVKEDAECLGDQKAKLATMEYEHKNMEYEYKNRELDYKCKNLEHKIECLTKEHEIRETELSYQIDKILHEKSKLVSENQSLLDRHNRDMEKHRADMEAMRLKHENEIKSIEAKRVREVDLLDRKLEQEKMKYEYDTWKGCLDVGMFVLGKIGLIGSMLFAKR